MRLTAHALNEIAEQVAALERSRLDVPEVRVHGYRVLLEREDSQRDGVTLFVVGIEKLD